MGTISKKFVVVTVLMISAIFLSTGLYAGTKVKDIIPMNNKAYKKHKKPVVIFTHKKHAEDYKISCGDCHHDDKGKALKLKMGDNVQNCIECHKNTGKLPKKIKKLKGKKKKAAKIKEMHKEAMHANCINCHKAFNKKTKSKKAPKSCKKCHLK